MFADLLRRLTAPAPERLPEPDARLALAALLVRVARSDGHYAPAEVDRIDRILKHRHGLTDGEVSALRAQAETLEAEAPDTVRFTRALKDAIPLEDRIAVVEALWSVALADGARDAHEDGLLRLLVNLLGVSDVESGLARKRAEGQA
ncbi:TerB family tellurite resistance protein [Jannaschia pohangensis]|uniref:Uncharacterized conserved protein, tellurite resistance protein B (TerB) family n=1 Tax=Jannaschia pohangensis TaxID=390807 RepID=A0A1I3N7N2_9RHOB|nr:TerB family tellurite resistance protein [Jannaschia pohangensis]SFJ05258.1 Uncharacterized conserved protein, tellurite resistance protein B (TerB) family [Jannaschia pohangensis]